MTGTDTSKCEVKIANGLYFRLETCFSGGYGATVSTAPWPKGARISFHSFERQTAWVSDVRSDGGDIGIDRTIYMLPLAAFEEVCAYLELKPEVQS